MRPSDAPLPLALTSTWLLPGAVWTPSGGLRRGLALGVDADGNITALTEAPPEDGVTRVHAPHRVLIAGMVNAHSHAFQRALRGTTEHLNPDHPGDDFWTWRDRMYRLALQLSPDDAYRIAAGLYREMLAAGYTSVGEFHYLHHRPDGQPYAPPERMAEALFEAASEAGIRLTLLATLYVSGDIHTPPSPQQRRFTHASFDAYVGLVEALRHRVRDNPLLSVGLAPHSIRAVPLDVLTELRDWNASAQLPVHMHVCEQPAEVARSKARLGAAPLELLDARGLLNPRFVGIHATHLEPGDPERLARAGARVCACPTTEANLGDGILPALDLFKAGVPVAIGSDSHITVNPFEEMRLIEHTARLKHQARNVLAGLMQPPGGPRPYAVAPGLMRCGSEHGARALGTPAGALAPGAPADLLLIDPDDLALLDVPDEAWVDALVFSAGPRCLHEVYVQGRQVYDASARFR